MSSAFVLINCKLGFDKEDISKLDEIPLSIAIYRVYGAYDIVVRVSAGMVPKLQEFLKSDLKKLDNIVSSL
jgi:DNA-binding Lrp family transcriptional regulator